MQQNNQDPYAQHYGGAAPYPPQGQTQYGGQAPQYGGQAPYPVQAPYGAPYGAPQGSYQQQAPYGQPPPYVPPQYAQTTQQAPYGQGVPQPNVYQGHGSGAGYTGYPGGAGAYPSGSCFDDIPSDKLLTADVDVAIRNGFVRKVYGILSVQLLITFGIATCFNVWSDAAVWLYQHYYLFIIASIALLASVCTLTCVPKTARRAPTNYVLLGVIAVCMGVVLGYATGAVDSAAFAIAAGMTAAVTIAVSLFACQTKYDFTGCGVYAFVGLILLMLFGLVTIFWRNQIAQLVYASLGAALFSFYIIMDTQMIVGGKHRAYQFSVDDYCFAALTLYMDIINLFMFILQIVAASRNN